MLEAAPEFDSAYLEARGAPPSEIAPSTYTWPSNSASAVNSTTGWVTRWWIWTRSSSNGRAREEFRSRNTCPEIC